MGDVLFGAACKLLAEEKTLAEPVAPGVMGGCGGRVGLASDAKGAGWWVGAVGRSLHAEES